MADIRNDQYLHRPGAGRGAITPADPLEVTLMGMIGKSAIRVERVMTVAANTEEVLIDITEPFLIDWMEWSVTSQNNPRPRIFVRVGGTYYPLGIVHRNASQVTGFNAVYLAANPSPLVDVMVYDTEVNEYKFGMRNLPPFPEGGRVVVQNSSASDSQIAIVLLGRQFS